MKKQTFCHFLPDMYGSDRIWLKRSLQRVSDYSLSSICKKAPGVYDSDVKYWPLNLSAYLKIRQISNIWQWFDAHTFLILATHSHLFWPQWRLGDVEGWHVSVLPDPMLVSCSGLLSILPCRRLLASCQTEDHQLSILLRKESLKPSDARSFLKQDHTFTTKTKYCRTEHSPQPTAVSCVFVLGVLCCDIWWLLNSACVLNSAPQVPHW